MCICLSNHNSTEKCAGAHFHISNLSPMFPMMMIDVFLSAPPEQGKVLKVLHTSEDAFIIAQYTLFHNEGPVQNMAIDGPKVMSYKLRQITNYEPSTRTFKVVTGHMRGPKGHP